MTSREVPAAELVEPLEARALCSAATAEFVIHVSVDGLRPDAITASPPSELPNFHRLRVEGAFTDNARSDYDSTVTLPNHAAQVTGRPTFGCGRHVRGHRWTFNGDAPAGRTIHRKAGGYVASAWDVAHDHGLRTALFATKTKFAMFDHSYDADARRRQGGAADVTGADNGRDKIDAFALGDSAVVTNGLVAAMAAEPFHYAMVHYRDPDEAGHGHGWMGGEYLEAVRAVDAQLGRILRTVDTTPALSGRTAIILTSDHGGSGHDHGAAGERLHYTIPFYVWGPGVAAGADLYALNPLNRLDPGGAAPDYAGTQPIRNGDAANLALDFLDLPSVPNSFFNADQRLVVTPGDVPTAPVTPPCPHRRRQRAGRPSPHARSLVLPKSDEMNKGTHLLSECVPLLQPQRSPLSILAPRGC